MPRDPDTMRVSLRERIEPVSDLRVTQDLALLSGKIVDPVSLLVTGARLDLYEIVGPLGIHLPGKPRGMRRRSMRLIWIACQNSTTGSADTTREKSGIRRTGFVP